uniref:Uncharacterized protein n=1 Tax=Panagrolaimus sp. JU765 TaxID=591449 RepID=A0AC34QWQ8_9BILA
MEEITKQQNLLEEINDQVMLLRKQNCDTKQKEQEMWDVQQGITILKRKLKMTSQDLKDEQNSKTTESETGSICEPGPKLEKHLLAVQNQLIEEIIEEQRQIVELSTRLEELQADLLLHEEQNGLSNREKTPLAARPKLPPPPPPPILDSNEIEKAIPTNGILEEIGQGCDECHRQESRHQILIDQIAKMRDECAQFRAKLEDSRETQKTITVDAADDFGTASVVVTKF